MQSIRPFVINSEYRKEKRKDKEEQEMGKLLDYFLCLYMGEGLTFFGDFAKKWNQAFHLELCNYVAALSWCSKTDWAENNV